MVILGTTSYYDIKAAMTAMKERMGTTHEIPKNPESCANGISSPVEESPEQLREHISEMGLQGD